MRRLRNLIHLPAALGRRSLASPDHGTTMVEFAAVSMLALLLTAALIDFGRLLWVYNVVPAAVREGARWAIVRGAGSGQTASAIQIETVVRNRAAALNRSDLQVTVTWIPDNKRGSVIEVKGTYPFRMVYSFIPGIGTITVVASTRMMIVH